jgi:hypothetical protein
LCTKAGLRDVEETALPVSVEHATFEEWWEPFTLGVGPAGAYVTSLDSALQGELRERCKERLGSDPFAIDSPTLERAGIYLIVELSAAWASISRADAGGDPALSGVAMTMRAASAWELSDRLESAARRGATTSAPSALRELRI